jgi:hypothetical protein
MDEREKRYHEAEPPEADGCSVCGGPYGMFLHDPITGRKTHTQCADGMPIVRYNGRSRIFGIRDDLGLSEPE